MEPPIGKGRCQRSAMPIITWERYTHAVPKSPQGPLARAPAAQRLFSPNESASRARVAAKWGPTRVFKKRRTPVATSAPSGGGGLLFFGSGETDKPKAASVKGLLLQFRIVESGCRTQTLCQYQVAT